MSFIATQDPTHKSLDDVPVETFVQEWWPDIDPNAARSILRLNGTVTNARLMESLQNSIATVNSELADWAALQTKTEPSKLGDQRIVDLYKRAVYFYSKADLTEKYADFDITGAGDRRTESMEGAVDSARRKVRWAISDILGKTRVTVELL